MVQEVIKTLSTFRVPLHDEKRLQAELVKLLPLFIPEYRLTESDIIDFYQSGIGIEVKIKGSRRQIFHQVERYCRAEGYNGGPMHTLILLTNRSMGLPDKIGNVTCHVVNLGKAWL